MPWAIISAGSAPGSAPLSAPAAWPGSSKPRTQRAVEHRPQPAHGPPQGPMGRARRVPHAEHHPRERNVGRNRLRQRQLSRSPSTSEPPRARATACETRRSRRSARRSGLLHDRRQKGVRRWPAVSPAALPSRIAARSVLLRSGGVSAGRVGLQGGCGERVERADGLGEGEDLAVHQALVELVQVKQLRLLRVPGLQQVGGRGAQRDGAEPGRVQR